MTTATLQGLLGRKLRTALTALAIVLGVAMVSGTFVLTDTMKKAFDDLFAGTYKNTGAVISGKEIVKGGRQVHGARVAADARWRRCPTSRAPPARSSTSAAPATS